MQDYIEITEKNGVTLLGTGKCQFCGANTQRGKLTTTDTLKDQIMKPSAKN